eukprot:gene37297-46022_t
MITTSGIVSVISGSLNLAATAASTSALLPNGDGGAVTSATFNSPYYAFVDTQGNLFVSDSLNNKIRKLWDYAPTMTPTLSPTVGPTVYLNTLNAIDTLVGTGEDGSGGDDGPPLQAQIGNVKSIWMSTSGDLYMSDSTMNVIRKLRQDSSTMTTIAGNGSPGSPGDNGPALSATFVSPMQIIGTNDGGIFIADTGNNVVRYISEEQISLFAGNYTSGSGGDGGQATSASLYSPTGLFHDDYSEELYISMGDQNVIRKVDQNGLISLYGGQVGEASYGGDGGPVSSALFNDVQQLYGDSAGRMFIADQQNGLVRMVVLTTSIITSVTGWGGVSVVASGPATSTSISKPEGVTGDTNGNLYISEQFKQRIKMVDTNGITSTLAGSGVESVNLQATCGDGGPLMNATFAEPHGLFFYTSQTADLNELLIADALGHKVRVIYKSIEVTNAPTSRPSISQTPTATPTPRPTFVWTPMQISTVAGNGVSAGDPYISGPATSVSISTPRGVWCDIVGNLYFTENTKHTVRKVSAISGIVTLLAGMGTADIQGDGVATSTKLSAPFQVLNSAERNTLLIAEQTPGRVRSLSLDTGIITTIVGSYVSPSTSAGDNGPATSANFNGLVSLFLDSSGNMFVLESVGWFVRKVDSDGIVSTIIGGGPGPNCCDAGSGTSVTLWGPYTVTGDTDKTLYIGDAANCRVRKYDVDADIVSTFVGNGDCTVKDPDVVAASSAFMRGPRGVSLDSVGNVFIGEYGGNQVKKITSIAGSLMSVAVAGTGVMSADPISVGDGGEPLSAVFKNMCHIFVDS